MFTDFFSKLAPNFLFILLRAGIVLTLLPFFSSRSFPAQFRIGIAVAISFVLAPVVDFHLAQSSVATIVVHEIMFGIIFGLAARFMFFAVDIAGHVMSAATGMSAASTFNPDIGPSTEIAQMYAIIATLLFFALDIHHDVILVLVKSYELLPVGTVNIGGMLAAGISFATSIFVIGLKLSAPIIIIALITNIFLGFIVRAIPQMNVFFVAQPVYISTGLLTMMIGLPIFISVLSGHFKNIGNEMGRVILMMRQ
jgi:flagellar biosynthetic protein FliR